MQNRHINRKRYFEEQSITTEKYVIPYINEVKSISQDTSILEIGCGEGGNLAPFLKAGCKRIIGIDISKNKIENAKQFFETLDPHHAIQFIADDIYNIPPEDLGQFDIIITRDVIEHIHGQEKFMDFVKNFLQPGGKIFFGFPPWYNPFGGHQQVCESKFLSKLPYFHILPGFFYKSILKIFGESETCINSLMEIKQTGISIDRFEKILLKTNYKTDKRDFFFINPHYEIKFGLKPRKAWGLISGIPFFRNFFITAAYYLVSTDTSMTASSNHPRHKKKWTQI